MFPSQKLNAQAKHGDRTEIFSGLSLLGDWGECTARVEVRSRSGRKFIAESMIVTQIEPELTNVNGFVISGSEWDTTNSDIGIPRPSRNGSTTYFYDVQVNSSVYGEQTVVEGEIEVLADVTRP